MFAAHKRCWVTEEQRRYYLQGCRSFKGAALKWSSLTKTDQISASSPTPRRWKERKCDFILSAAVSKDNVRDTAEAEVFTWNYIASGLSPAGAQSSISFSISFPVVLMSSLFLVLFPQKILQFGHESPRRYKITIRTQLWIKSCWEWIWQPTTAELTPCKRWGVHLQLYVIKCIWMMIR